MLKIFFLILLTGCSLSTEHEITVSLKVLNPNVAIEKRAPGLMELRCIFLNVVGEGIPGAVDWTPLSSPCIQPGLITPVMEMASVDRETTINFTVPPGQHRLIRVLGLKWDSGAGFCPFSSLNEYFSATIRPQIYEIARQENVDFFQDATVVLAQTYDQNNTTNLATPCTSSK